MSRVGKAPVEIPKGVEVAVSGNSVTVKGPKGTLVQTFRPVISIATEDGKVVLSRENDLKTTRALHGTSRALVANMVEGVTKGFEKVLEIHGVGYRGRVEGDKLVLMVGKSHEPAIKIPAGLKVEVEKNTIIKVAGADKHEVGQFSATVRAVYPPEPFLGKGIRYQDEHVRRKAGKKMVG